MMELKDVYTKLYKNIRSGKYDTVVADENSFKMKTSISFVDLLEDCDKYGVDMESFLRYLKEQKKNCVKTSNYGEHELTTYDSTERYPTSVLRFATDKQKEALHPTQKPVALFEYLIKTYTNEGETVLDNCIGSGTAAIACMNTNRKFIGIELEKEYVDIANERLEKAKGQRRRRTIYQPREVEQ